jgi:hypothetical protein
MHSILGVIESFYCIKDCENNPPIATTDSRDEMTVFGKTENFRSRFAISEILWSNFAISEIFAIGVFSSV